MFSPSMRVFLTIPVLPRHVEREGEFCTLVTNVCMFLYSLAPAILMSTVKHSRLGSSGIIIILLFAIGNSEAQGSHFSSILSTQKSIHMREGGRQREWGV